MEGGFYKLPSTFNRIGELTYNRFGTLAKIVEYTNWENIIVEFQDDFKYRIKTTYQNFKNRQLRNVYDKHICNVAYIGEGPYQIKENGRNSKAYSHWCAMIHRCYGNDKSPRNRVYKNCTVCEEWLCFQNFAKWFNEHFYTVQDERMCLDKDILGKGSNIYSPLTCLIVPEKINLLFSINKSMRGQYPIGVSNTSGSIIAVCANENGVSQYLGAFPNQIDAFNAYKKYKEKVIKKVAERYKEYLPLSVYNALLQYEVAIND